MVSGWLSEWAANFVFESRHAQLIASLRAGLIADLGSVRIIEKVVHKKFGSGLEAQGLGPEGLCNRGHENRPDLESRITFAALSAGADLGFDRVSKRGVTKNLKGALRESGGTKSAELGTRNLE